MKRVIVAVIAARTIITKTMTMMTTMTRLRKVTEFRSMRTFRARETASVRRTSTDTTLLRAPGKKKIKLKFSVDMMTTFDR